MKTRFLALLLVCLLVIATVSCGQGSSDDAVTDATTTTTVAVTVTEDNTPKETQRADVKDSLPDDLNFADAQINVIIRPEMANYDATGELSGDTVYDAVYNRNLAVEERLGVKLNYIMTKDNDFNAMADQVANSIMSGADEYDVVMQRGVQTFGQSLKGLYADLHDAPYIDTKQPWWWMNLVESTSINSNRTYFLTGDMSASTFLFSTACFFNKDMLKDHGHNVDDLYALVENGQWTYEQFEQYCQDVYSDKNGNGIADYEDLYAFSYLDYGASWFTSSAGMTYITRDAEGYPMLAFNQENANKLLVYLNRLWYENNYSFLDPSGDYVQLVQNFMNGGTLFLMGRFYHAPIMRDSSIVYGVIPYPKLDESMSYMSGTGSSGNFISVPTTCQKFDATCAALEALSAESYRSVFPAIYEVTLKIKYVSDNKDAQMIDIIHDSVYVDFLMIAELDNVIDSLLNTHSTNFSSAFKAKEKLMGRTIEAMIKSYNSLT